MRLPAYQAEPEVGRPLRQRREPDDLDGASRLPDERPLAGRLDDEGRDGAALGADRRTLPAEPGENGPPLPRLTDGELLVRGTRRVEFDRGGEMPPPERPLAPLARLRTLGA